jgi:predicted N-acetyltransferase YhbS
MTEIRSIRDDEAESFLQLVCRAFDLDIRRARSIFYYEPYFNLGRKWALFVDGYMASVLTVTPLIFGWGRAIGFAGVATETHFRSQGLASQLMRHVLETAEAEDEAPALLFARDPRLYETLGFKPIDRVVRAPIQVQPTADGSVLAFEDVRRIYDAWAQGSPNRLRRDDLRWRYWEWQYRVCERLGDGYLAAEPGVLREAILTGPVSALPLPRDTEWLGLDSMSEKLDLPLGEKRPDLHLMSRGFPGLPEMFLTDQF